MTTRHFLISAWNFNPWLITLCAAVIFAYGVRSGTRFRQRVGWLLTGLTVFYLTFASPLDALANGYLFSAHMLQHLLLLLIIPSLILLSLQPSPVPESFLNGHWRWLNWMLCRPVFTWLLGVGGMWLWHAPILCNAAVTNGWVHHFQYLSLLLMGFAFWWPIIGPWNKQWMSPPAGIIYLFSACLGCTILGIIITFAPVEVCSVYLHPMDRLGILSLIQGQWGLTPARDQEVGGLLMWVPACLVYFCGILGLLVRWYGGTDDQTILSESQSKDISTEKSYDQ